MKSVGGGCSFGHNLTLNPNLNLFLPLTGRCLLIAALKNPVLRKKYRPECNKLSAKTL